jgi:hypothetical protein
VGGQSPPTKVNILQLNNHKFENENENEKIKKVEIINIKICD